jgi:hypothetical protein
MTYILDILAVAAGVMLSALGVYLGFRLSRLRRTRADGYPQTIFSRHKIDQRPH